MSGMEILHNSLYCPLTLLGTAERQEQGKSSRSIIWQYPKIIDVQSARGLHHALTALVLKKDVNTALLHPVHL